MKWRQIFLEIYFLATSRYKFKKKTLSIEKLRYRNHLIVCVYGSRIPMTQLESFQSRKYENIPIS